MGRAQEHMEMRRVTTEIFFADEEGLSELEYEAKKATLNGDNQSTLTLIKSQKMNDLTKHVAVTYHQIRNLVLEQNWFSLQYVPSSENLADICTKGLARGQYEKLRGVIINECIMSEA